MTSRSSATRKPKPSPAAKTGVPICVTCGERFDVEFVKGMPKFYDHNTKKPHLCKTRTGDSGAL